MTRRFAGLIGGLIALAVLLGSSPAAVAQPDRERILNYVVTADVRADGSVAVTERVRYHFVEPKHGFFRHIPLYYPVTRADGTEDPYDARKLEIADYTASMDGGAVPFERDTESAQAKENFVVKIGDKNATITGDHDYELSYVMRGLLNKPNGEPELFWAAIGRDFNVLIDRAEVTVTAPGPISRVQCRAGRNAECVAEENGNTAKFTVDKLGASYPVNVVVRLPDNVTVPAPIIRAKPAYAGGIRDNILNPGREEGIPETAVLLTVLGFVLGAGVLFLVFLRTRDKYFVGVIPGLLPDRPNKAPQKRRWRNQRAATSVRFDPPKNIPAALCGVILRKRADRNAVGAAVTDLAVRGHLRIIEEDGGFSVERIKNGESVKNFEQPILRGLSSKVTLPGRKNDALPFKLALGKLPGELLEEAERRNWFRGNPRKNSFRGWGFLLLFVSLWPMIWLAEHGLLWLWFPFALTVLILMFLPGRWLSGRTAVGSTVLAQVLDFRRYIETAEATQIAEEERKAIFNRYLPYAQVFGLAEVWSKKFALLGAAEPGDWYVGSSTPDYSGVYFAASYSTFTSTVDSSVASSGGFSFSSSGTGSSSSWSGGSSGFDSGGSSGGGDGGGGGGGGSW
jgi:uncharacterized membrane protein YgcG